MNALATLLLPHQSSQCCHDPTLLVYAIINPKRPAKCRIIFCTILQLGISVLPGPRYQQRSDVLRYVEAEEAGEPQNSIHEARREEELGVVKER